MSFEASDGRHFPSYMQLQKYENWLKESGKAPGGPSHVMAIQEHGPVSKLTIEREGMGRHRVTATHKDGQSSTVVYPDAQRAHGIAAEYLGISPTPSQAVHQRSRAAGAVGKGEKRRLDREDGRVENTIEPAPEAKN